MWLYLEYIAWAVSAALLLWMLFDAVKVSQRYDEDLLLSSKEGIDEMVEHEHESESNGGGAS